MYFHSGEWKWKGCSSGVPPKGGGQELPSAGRCQRYAREAALTQDGGRSASSATSREPSRVPDVEEAGGFGDGVYHDAQGEAGGGGGRFLPPRSPGLWRGLWARAERLPAVPSPPRGSASPWAAFPRAPRGWVRPRGRRETRPTGWARGSAPWGG